MPKLDIDKIPIDTHTGYPEPFRRVQVGRERKRLGNAAGLDQFREENLHSPKIKSLMGKVVLQKDVRIEKNFPAEWSAHVSVHLTNGNHFEKYIRFPKGDPENPLTWQELSAKFHSLATRVFSGVRCDQIINSAKDTNSPTEFRKIWKLAARPDSFSVPAS